MQIQLKQVEIVDALKQYVTRQGFDLAGKTVIIGFTAGRKESGLSADISIEDVQIPGTDGAEEELAVAKLALIVVPTKAAAAPVVAQEPETLPPTVQVVATPVGKTPTSSLFG